MVPAAAEEEEKEGERDPSTQNSSYVSQLEVSMRARDAQGKGGRRVKKGG